MTSTTSPQAFNIEADMNVTAVFLPTVVYDGNGATGGSVPVDSKGYAAGASATVLGNTNYLLKTGYTFSGWNTAADGSGTTYAAGGTLTMGSSPVTLYAKWVGSGSTTTGITLQVPVEDYVFNITLGDCTIGSLDTTSGTYPVYTMDCQQYISITASTTPTAQLWEVYINGVQYSSIYPSGSGIYFSLQYYPSAPASGDLATGPNYITFLAKQYSGVFRSATIIIKEME